LSDLSSSRRRRELARRRHERGSVIGHIHIRRHRSAVGQLGVRRRGAGLLAVELAHRGGGRRHGPLSTTRRIHMPRASLLWHRRTNRRGSALTVVLLLTVTLAALAL